MIRSIWMVAALFWPALAAYATELSDASAWRAHLQNDLLPYWRQPAAQGTPVGHFPTFRCEDGAAFAPEKPCESLAQAPAFVRDELGRHYVRMQARQVFAYAAGFHMTGDVALLRLATAGLQDIRERAVDPATGSVATFIDADGSLQPPVGERTVQDLAYAALAFASVHYLTRDPATLDQLDRLHRHVMQHWDAERRQMRWTLRGPQRGELVAQLDPLNAYMVLTTPLLSGERARRWTADMRALAGAIRTHYCPPEGGRCRGTLEARGDMPGARHNDFGHSGKAFWMAMLVGRQIGDRNMLAWARASAQTLLAQAYDGDDETWASRWTADGVDSGRTWWIHAELDQLAAALAVDGRFDTDRLARTQTYWLRHFVDRRYGEVYGGLSPAGEPPSHSLKQHQWKNGYHSTEHALVGYLAWHALRREPAPLYFATPPGARLTPYFFEGSVVRSERVGSFDGQPITRVHFFLQTDR